MDNAKACLKISDCLTLKIRQFDVLWSVRMSQTIIATRYENVFKLLFCPCMKSLKNGVAK